MVLIGRFDIFFADSSFNCFSASPRENHIKWLVKIFGHFQDSTERQKSLVISTDDISDISGKEDNTSDWLEKYLNMTADIDEGLPDPRGCTIITLVYFDSDHSHNQLTRQSVSGVMCFVGSTPISWSSKRQNGIEMYRYSEDFCVGRVATEEAISMRYILRFLCVPVKVPTTLCVDNLGMIISSTKLYLDLKNKYVVISYHKLQYSASAGIVNPIKVCMTVNKSVILTKSMLV